MLELPFIGEGEISTLLLMGSFWYGVKRSCRGFKYSVDAVSIDVLVDH